MKSLSYYGIGNDEYKYYKTIDNGKTWFPIGEGDGPLIIKNDRMIISGGYSDDNLATIKEGKEGELFKKDDEILLKNDEGIYKTEDGEKWERVGPADEFPKETDPLLYLLNDVIIYNLTNMLADEHDLSKLSYSNYNGPDKFFTNSQLYKDSIEGIDYASDVGMRPFSESDLAEYQELENIKEEIKNEFLEDPTEAKVDKMLEENKSLKKSFQIIDLKLNNLKKLMQENSVKDIQKKEENYEGIPKEDIGIMESFYEVRKGTEESIVGTIINSIFTFNNSKKLALLKMSILETARLLKEGINFNLNLLNEKYNKNITTEDIQGMKDIEKTFDFNLKEAWGKGLRSSIEKYYYEAINNIYSITENEDKDLIYIASEKYKENRSDLLSKAYSKLRMINHIDKDSSNIKNKLNDCANDYYKKVINSNKSPETVLALFEDYKKANQAVLEECAEEFKDIAKEYKLNFYNNMKDIEITYFSKEDYEEDLKDLSFDTSDRVYNYYKQIIDKFKSRCIELYEMISNQTISNYIIPYINLESLIYNWTYDSLNNNFDKPIPTITNEVKDMINDMDSVMERSWNGAKELI